MIIQIETVTTDQGKMDVIRDMKKVQRVLDIAAKAIDSIRDFRCGHKPFGVGGKCEACEALKEWDVL